MLERDQWRQVEPLFDRALDLEGDERCEFVAAVMRRSPSLGRKLRQLLDAADGASDVIVDRSLHEVAGALVERVPLSRITGIGVGSVLGSYRLERSLGKGGAGEVFLATARGCPAPVALKLMTNAAPDFVARFEREQSILGELDHPGVVPVLDRGESPYGHPYYTMPFIDGWPVTEYCSRVSWDLRVVLGLFRDLCDAVGAAHRIGVVHRDLKPSNVLVEERDHRRRPFVLDFGAARDGACAELTMTGQVIGTPGYMSPEQARGDSRGVDARSDVFSLGVLAWEMLTGNNPFRRESAVETQAALIMEPPGRLREAVPTLDEPTATVVERCLEKRPEDRFASVDDLLAAIA